MRLNRKVFSEHREAVLYVICGGFTTLVTWGSYALFVILTGDVFVSNALSWVCGVSFAFVVNKMIVFSSRSLEAKTVFRELSSFFSARIFTGVIAITTFPILYSFGMDGSLFGIDGFPARMATSCVEIVLNWIFSKYFIFKKKAADTSEDTNKKDEEK
ncbi:MAG: GtrA family protein [Methanomassiliicoccaceae archaeon]|nr:GtrA family protein [Methanomassiliicoccaceae archaeon]